MLTRNAMNIIPKSTKRRQLQVFNRVSPILFNHRSHLEVYRFYDWWDRSVLPTWWQKDRTACILSINTQPMRECSLRDSATATMTGISSQVLLEPVIFEVPPGKIDQFAGQLETLQHLGFEIEPFGSGSYRIRSITRDCFQRGSAGSCPRCI